MASNVMRRVLQFRRLCGLKPCTTLRVLALTLLLATALHADVVMYQGRLRVEGAAVEGLGRFKFALIDANGAAVWSSQPMNLHVSDGVYAVRLGDSAQAPPIADGLLRGAKVPKLRISFERAEHGWSVAGPDVALAGEQSSEGAATSAQLASVMSELKEIRALIEGKPSARTVEAETVTVSVAGAPSLGSADAPLVLVEFTDFQCPYSIGFQTVFEALKTKYVDTGRLRVVSRNVPQEFHPLAGPAARAARCAQEQGRFWEMRARLFAANGELSPGALRKAAADAGLDAGKFEACLASAESAAAVDKDARDAKAAGIVPTPTFVLGKQTGDKVTGPKLVGAQSLVRLEIEMRKVVPGFSPSQRPMPDNR